MKKILIVIYIFIILGHLCGDFSGMNTGTRSLGMGNAYSAMGEGAESLFYNPAGTANTQENLLSLSYQNHFGISDLTNLNMAALVPVTHYNIGLAIQRVNLLDVYNENVMYLNSSYKFKMAQASLNLGMNCRYYMVSGAESEVDITSPFDLDLGILYHYKGFRAGYSSRNILRLKGEEDNIFSSQLLGLAVNWEELLNVAADYEISEIDNILRLGIELWFYETFAPRIGFDDEYLTMGFGLKSSWWSFDFALKTHEELGTTYRFGINLNYKRSGL
jgi:hypothetical protein